MLLLVAAAVACGSLFYFLVFFWKKLFRDFL